MPKFLDTRGKPTLGIGICARCSVKMSLSDLHPDPNSPGLMVCVDDLDVLDPYRLPAREPDRVTLENPRPDVALSPGPMAVYADKISGISSIKQPLPWQANAVYTQGMQVTPGNPYGPNVPYLIYVYMCLVAGTAGAVAPSFPTNTGQTVIDGTVTWINQGLFEP